MAQSSTVIFGLPFPNSITWQSAHTWNGLHLELLQVIFSPIVPRMDQLIQSARRPPFGLMFAGTKVVPTHAGWRSQVIPLCGQTNAIVVDDLMMGQI